MTFEQLMASPAEMEKFTDEELLVYFAPYIKFCRPNLEEIKARREKTSSAAPDGIVKKGMFAGHKKSDALLMARILEAAAKQTQLPLKP